MAALTGPMYRILPELQLIDGYLGLVPVPVLRAYGFFSLVLVILRARDPSGSCPSGS